VGRGKVLDDVAALADRGLRLGGERDAGAAAGYRDNVGRVEWLDPHLHGRPARRPAASRHKDIPSRRGARGHSQAHNDVWYPRRIRRSRVASRVPAADQALRILRLLARRPGPMPAAAIATELGLPRSSTYHLLAVLGGQGFVTHLPEERAYGLGVTAFEVGSAYLRQDPLERLARPLLSRL